MRGQAVHRILQTAPAFAVALALVAFAAAPAAARDAAQPRAKVPVGVLSFASLKYGWAAGSMGAIIRTKDGGRHWARQYARDKWFVDQTGFTAVEAISSSTCWIVGSGYIYKTTDGGAHWTRLAKKQRASQFSGNSWSDSAFIGNVGWVVSSCGDIIRTKDGGRTWTRQRNAEKGDDHIGGLWALDTRHAYIAMNGVGGPYLLATTDGAHWTQASERPFWSWHPDLTGVCANNAGHILLTARTGEVFESRDAGKTWRPSNPGVGPEQLFIGDVACFGTTICAVGGNAQNLGSAILSGNDGWSWGWVGFAPAGGTAPLPIGDIDWLNEKTGWTCGGGGQIYRTMDRGVTWTKLR